MFAKDSQRASEKSSAMDSLAPRKGSMVEMICNDGMLRVGSAPDEPAAINGTSPSDPPLEQVDWQRGSKRVNGQKLVAPRVPGATDEHCKSEPQPWHDIRLGDGTEQSRHVCALCTVRGCCGSM